MPKHEPLPPGEGGVAVHLIQKNAQLPFDVAPNRTIYFDFDIEEANKAQIELEGMIKSAETDTTAVMTPLSLAIDLAPLDGSKNPVEAGISEILALAQDIRAIVGQLDLKPIDLKPSPMLEGTLGLLRNPKVSSLGENVISSLDLPITVTFDERTPKRGAASSK
jgi:hypothetical protein